MRIKLNCIEPKPNGYIWHRIIHPEDVRIWYIVSDKKPNALPNTISDFWITGFKFKINK